MPDTDDLVEKRRKDEPHLSPLSDEGEFPCFLEVRAKRRPNDSGQG
jgi:hypothetical protein